MKKKRFVLVGTGGRARLFIDAILGPFRDHCELTALCDSNRLRMDYQVSTLVKVHGNRPLAAYHAADFDQMIHEQKPDAVIVATMDRVHHHYIIRAMELGCDVITEKPMTTDATKCRAILQAVKSTGKKLRVTFNYRYSPTRMEVKKILAAGEIGDVTSVHFEWLLDTYHGADYFRRWHRDKINSGGLMVHKATHHFDLVNWWLNTRPETVFGFGRLAFYGRANAEARGVQKFYSRSTGEPAAVGDPFAIDLRDGAGLQGLYFDAEQEDGYRRDQSVFGDGISIEDTMNVLVRYQTGAQMSYSLIAYAPWEGMRVAFNGTKGRLELEEVERSYINAGGEASAEGALGHSRIVVQEQWRKPREVEVQKTVGSHGGGDSRMLEDLFGAEKHPDPCGCAAGYEDGAYSVLVGVAANESFATGRPVQINQLLGGI
jgi:predicted dehydrogenase